MGILDEAAVSARQLLEALPNAIALVGAEGTIVDFNSRLTAMTGFTRDELAGQSVRFLDPPSNTEEHLKVVRDFTAAPHEWQTWRDQNLFIARKDGSEVSVNFALSRIILNEQRLVLVAIGDNSAQREAESARADAEVRASIAASRRRGSPGRKRTAVSPRLREQYGTDGLQ